MFDRIDIILSYSQEWKSLKDLISYYGIQKYKNDFIDYLLKRFNLSFEQVYNLLTTCDITILTDDNFVTIWEALDFYQMSF